MTNAPLGWKHFPVKFVEDPNKPGKIRKQPLVREWQLEESYNADGTFKDYCCPEHTTWGVPVGLMGLVVIDLDNRDGKQGSIEFEKLQAQHGQLPDTYKVATPTGGFHLYFQAPAEKIKSRADTLAVGVDVKASGGYVVAPGSLDHLGREYTPLNQLRIAELTPAWIALLPKESPPQPPPAFPPTPVELARVESALSAIPVVDYATRDEWLHIIMAVHEATQGSAEGMALAARWSMGDPGRFHYDEFVKDWKSFKLGKGITAATLYHNAQEYGWKFDTEISQDEDLSVSELVIHCLGEGNLLGSALRAKVSNLARQKITNDQWKQSLSRLLKSQRIYSRRDDEKASRKWYSLEPMAEIKLVSGGQIVIRQQSLRPVVFNPMNAFCRRPSDLARGVEPGSVILINGSAGTGKSWMMLRSAIFAAQSGERVVYYHTEMPTSEYANRATRFILQKDKVTAQEIHATMAGLNIQFANVGQGSISVPMLLKRARDATFIVLDYFAHFRFDETMGANKKQASPVQTILARIESQLGERIFMTGVQILKKKYLKKEGHWDIEYAGGGSKALFTPSYVFDIVRIGKVLGDGTCRIKVQVSKARNSDIRENEIFSFSLDMATQKLEVSNDEN